jgi:hypothetical protein
VVDKVKYSEADFTPSTLQDFVEYLTKRKKGAHLYTELGLEMRKD